MKCFDYSHQNGAATIPNSVLSELKAAIAEVDVPGLSGAGNMIRTGILRRLSECGWSGEFSVDPTISKTTITSVKAGVGLCIQTGNYARIYADLMKLQKLYLEEKLSVGVLIIPTAPAARLIGDNIVNYGRLETELHVFRKVIHMPLVVLAFE